MNQASNRQRVAALVALSLGLLTVALVASIVVVGLPTQENVASQETAEPSGEQEIANVRSRLFDFANYKRLFRKTYSGFLEEMARQKYFLARASRVFIAAMKYRYKKTLYYLSLNHLSDATPQELDKMLNRHMVPEAAQAAMGKIKPGNDIGANLPEQTAAGKRKKRSVTPPSSSWSNGKLRELPLSKLINAGQDFHLDPEVEKKIVTKVTKDVNPDYKPYDLVSYGLVDELEPIAIWNFIEPEISDDDDQYGEHDDDSSDDESSDDESSDGESSDDEEEEVVLEDKVFVDLRKSTKCFFPARDQGYCGSCYAFAATAMMEWLYCMKTGQLVPLSEQYMIDCGKPYVNELFGCVGGNWYGAAAFVHNFGLELRSHYPYFMREHQCPYDEDEPLKTIGYIRTKMPSVLAVDEDKMAEYVQYGPMYVAIALGPSFHEYGGGVHGLPCDENTTSQHAVVLVGHGRENGLEYWLLRNSYSLYWGEEGYYKLDKEVGGICFERSWMYATEDGEQVKLEVGVNRNSDRMKIETAATLNRRDAIEAARVAAAAAQADTSNRKLANVAAAAAEFAAMVEQPVQLKAAA